MSKDTQHLEALNDIKQMMQRSSRFISLSGLSGIAAGFWALVGAYFAYDWIYEYYQGYNDLGYSGSTFIELRNKLFLLACTVLFLSILSAFYFTWRRTNNQKRPFWDYASKQLIVNFSIPLITGGLVILVLLQYNDWKYIAPLCLIFYGLALINGSKYTLSDIRYLGFCEIILGLINTQYIGYGLHFWAFGFGVLHIIYGFIMWWKYERS